MTGLRPLTFDYVNHRGETRNRAVVPRSIRYGHHELHGSEPLWLLDAYDLDKNEDRTLRRPRHPRFRPMRRNQDAASATLRSGTGLRPSLHMPAPPFQAEAKQGEMALEGASQRRNRAKQGEALSRENARERDERDATETQEDP